MLNILFALMSLCYIASVSAMGPWSPLKDSDKKAVKKYSGKTSRRLEKPQSEQSPDVVLVTTTTPTGSPVKKKTKAAKLDFSKEFISLKQAEFDTIDSYNLFIENSKEQEKNTSEIAVLENLDQDYNSEDESCIAPHQSSYFEEEIELFTEQDLSVLAKEEREMYQNRILPDIEDALKNKEKSKELFIETFKKCLVAKKIEDSRKRLAFIEHCYDNDGNSKRLLLENPTQLVPSIRQIRLEQTRQLTKHFSHDSSNLDSNTRVPRLTARPTPEKTNGRLTRLVSYPPYICPAGQKFKNAIEEKQYLQAKIQRYETACGIYKKLQGLIAQ